MTRKGVYTIRINYMLIGYLFGYIASLMITGIQDWYYLIPLKALGIIFSLTIGNLLYFAIEEKESIFMGVFRSLKYIVVAIVLTIVLTELELYMYEANGVDIGFIVGFRT